MPAEHGDDERVPPASGARMGVDVGSVRIGVAVSDPAGLVATPVCTVQRDGAQDVAQVARVATEHDVVVVYVGLPKHLSGAEGAASRDARTYAEALAGAVRPVEVRLVDERLTTVTAHQALHASGRAGRRHRAVVDQAAAVVILQSALDAERNRGARAGEQVPAQDDPGHGHTDEVGGPVGRTDQMRDHGRGQEAR